MADSPSKWYLPLHSSVKTSRKHVTVEFPSSPCNTLLITHCVLAKPIFVAWAPIPLDDRHAKCSWSGWDCVQHYSTTCAYITSAFIRSEPLKHFGDICQWRFFASSSTRDEVRVGCTASYRGTPTSLTSSTPWTETSLSVFLEGCGGPLSPRNRSLTRNTL